VVLQKYTEPNLLKGISVDSQQAWLAGVSSDTVPDSVRLYDISSLVKGPVLRDRELFATANPNAASMGGPAATAFGGNYLFALDSNNGIKAFLIDTNYVPVAPTHKSLLLDLGPTPCVYADATNSVAHAVGAVPLAEVTWNTVTADSGALAYSDGTLASGVSINLGRGTNYNGTVDFNDESYTVNALGTTINTGIYGGTCPARDGIYGSTPNNYMVGLRVDGLAPGTYTVYVSGRNSNVASTLPVRFFCTNGPIASTFSTNSTTWADESNSASPINTASFVNGNNCTLLVVTIGTNDSLYLAAAGTTTNELRGFLNSVEVVPGSPAYYPAKITVQPANQTSYAAATSTSITAQYTADPLLPLYAQWFFNGTTAITGATNSTLVLSNITAAMAGAYSLSVSNAAGSDRSSNATLTVLPLDNTPQMTNIWNLPAGSRSYLSSSSTGNFERGLAYNSQTTNLLLVSRAATNIVVLDAQTGAEKGFLNTNGIGGGVLLINMVGVGGDGAVYVGNLTFDTNPYSLYRWPDDSGTNVPQRAYSGAPDPSASSSTRWGDNMAVRGAGTNTQILIASDLGTNVVLLSTTNGVNFTNTVIKVSGVPAGFAQTGIAFASSNTFWAKTMNQQLYLVQFDLGSNPATGAVVTVYPNNVVGTTLRSISTDGARRWLAGISSEVNDNVRLYDVSNLTNGPVLRDQELFATENAIGTLAAGVGATAFGGNYLFALNCNNGIKAFLIDTNYAPPLSADGSYEVDLDNASGTPGGTPGWNWLNFPNYSVSVAATPAHPYTIRLVSQASGAPGLAAGFLSRNSYSWCVATSAVSILNFTNPSQITVDSSQFQNFLGGGSFSVTNVANSISVIFTPRGCGATGETTNGWAVVAGNIQLSYTNAYGMKSVQGLRMTNCTVTAIAYGIGLGAGTTVGQVTMTNAMALPEGTTNLVLVATKIIPGNSATVNALVTDECGANGVSFDPVFTTLQVGPSGGVRQVFTGIMSVESFVQICNGNPGLKYMHVIVNGQTFMVDNLLDNEVVVVDVSAAMNPGSDNVVVLEGYGRPGASAFVTISDVLSKDQATLGADVPTVGNMDSESTLEAPMVTVTRGGNNIVLSWSGTLGDGYEVQGRESVTSQSGWVTVAVPVSGQYAVTLSAGSKLQLFRIYKP